MDSKLITQSFNLWVYVCRGYTVGGYPIHPDYRRLVERTLRRYLRRVTKYRNQNL